MCGPGEVADRQGRGHRPVCGLPSGESQAAKRRLDSPTPGPPNIGGRHAPGPKGTPDHAEPATHRKIVTELPPIVAEHIAAVNAFDTDRIVDTFAPDAYVNDNHREIWGADAIWKFMAKEFVGDHVTMEVREVIDHYGDIIVRAKYDGTYDKTNLPDELIMSSRPPTDPGRPA